MSDQNIEQIIQAKNLSAPRVSYADVVANIKHSEILQHVSESGQVLRWSLATLLNGYTVVGRPSVAVSSENDDAEVGEQVARENTFNEIWPLMGYALKQQLHEATSTPPAPGAAHPGYSTLAPHQQRVVDELAELQDKIRKLETFSGTPDFAYMPEAEKGRLYAQHGAMTAYRTILAERVAAFTGAAA